MSWKIFNKFEDVNNFFFTSIHFNIKYYTLIHFIPLIHCIGLTYGQLSQSQGHIFSAIFNFQFSMLFFFIQLFIFIFFPKHFFSRANRTIEKKRKRASNKAE